MKKMAIMLFALGLMATSLSGCTKEEAQAKLAPVLSGALGDEVEAIFEGSKKEEATAPEEVPVLPSIDPSIKIQAGSRIAVVSKGTKGEYWAALQAGMKDAVRDINTAYGFTKADQITLTYEGTSKEGDVTTQVNILDAVIAENPDVLALSASDMNSCVAQLEAAKENGIPVVAFDTNVSETDLITAFRASDNYAIGEIAAVHLANALGKMGKVAIFSEQGKSQSIQDRVTGFVDTMMAYGDIEILEIVYMNEVSDMETAMQEVLHKYTELNGIFCTNADSSDLYLNMKKDETLNSVAMVGVDATKRQQEAVKNYEEIGIVSQHPYAIGYQTIWTAAQCTVRKKDRDVPQEILINPVWVDASNIDKEYLVPYLY